MLVLSRKKNESIVINNDITVTVVEIRGDKVRLGIVAPKEVPVHRQEVFDAIHGKEPSSEAAPGIRLKSIRDGIQDYEYAQILRNLGQDAFVNSTIQPLATSWTNWKNDPNAMESARIQLGQMLNQLSPP